MEENGGCCTISVYSREISQGVKIVHINSVATDCTRVLYRGFEVLDLNSLAAVSLDYLIHLKYSLEL